MTCLGILHPGCHSEDRNDEESTPSHPNTSLRGRVRPPRWNDEAISEPAPKPSWERTAVSALSPLVILNVVKDLTSESLTAPLTRTSLGPATQVSHCERLREAISSPVPNPCRGGPPCPPAPPSLRPACQSLSRPPSTFVAHTGRQWAIGCCTPTTCGASCPCT